MARENWESKTNHFRNVVLAGLLYELKSSPNKVRELERRRLGNKRIRLDDKEPVSGGSLLMELKELVKGVNGVGHHRWITTSSL